MPHLLGQTYPSSSHTQNFLSPGQSRKPFRFCPHHSTRRLSGEQHDAQQPDGKCLNLSNESLGGCLVGCSESEEPDANTRQQVEHPLTTHHPSAPLLHTVRVLARRRSEPQRHPTRNARAEEPADEPPIDTRRSNDRHPTKQRSTPDEPPIDSRRSNDRLPTKQRSTPDEATIDSQRTADRHSTAQRSRLTAAAQNPQETKQKPSLCSLCSMWRAQTQDSPQPRRTHKNQDRNPGRLPHRAKPMNRASSATIRSRSAAATSNSSALAASFIFSRSSPTRRGISDSSNSASSLPE